MRTLASQAETGVWVQASGCDAAEDRGYGPGKNFETEFAKSYNLMNFVAGK